MVLVLRIDLNCSNYPIPTLVPYVLRIVDVETTVDDLTCHQRRDDREDSLLPDFD